MLRRCWCTGRDTCMRPSHLELWRMCDAHDQVFWCIGQRPVCSKAQPWLVENQPSPAQTQVCLHCIMWRKHGAHAWDVLPVFWACLSSASCAATAQQGCSQLGICMLPSIACCHLLRTAQDPELLTALANLQACQVPVVFLKGMQSGSGSDRVLMASRPFS